MTSKRNNFDGGTDGTVISTSNSGNYGNDAFDSVSGSGFATVVYANVASNNLNRQTAEYVMKIATGNSSGFPYVTWSSLGQLTQVWTRFYFYVSANTIITAGDLNLFSIRKAGTRLVSVWLDTDTANYNPYVINDYMAGSPLPMSSPVTAGVWNRIEFRATIATGTSGNSTLNFYGNNDADSDTYTETLSQNSQNYGSFGYGDTFTIGMDGYSQLNSAAVYFANWEVNNTGYPGPAPFRQGLGTPSGNLTNPVAIHMV